MTRLVGEDVLEDGALAPLRDGLGRPRPDVPEVGVVDRLQQRLEGRDTRRRGRERVVEDLREESSRNLSIYLRPALLVPLKDISLSRPPWSYQTVHV